MRLLLLALVCSPLVARAQDCVADDALSRAAALLVGVEPAASGAALLEAVRAEGSDAPVAEALLIRDGDPARRGRFLARVARRRTGPLACGDARDGDRWLVIAAPRAGRIEVVSEDVVRVELAAGWRSARLYARGADGLAWHRSARPGEPVALPSDLARPVRVQVVAEGPDGPRPVAERILGGGSERRSAPTDEPPAARLRDLRSSEGLGALRENRLLARVARDHAEALCRDGRVSHLGGGGDPRERLARAGVRARHVGEVVARAADPSAAYDALTSSPSHRVALTDRRFTDAGIASARDPAGRACLVVLLAAWPRAVPHR